MRVNCHSIRLLTTMNWHTKLPAQLESDNNQFKKNLTVFCMLKTSRKKKSVSMFVTVKKLTLNKLSSTQLQISKINFHD